VKYIRSVLPWGTQHPGPLPFQDPLIASTRPQAFVVELVEVVLFPWVPLRNFFPSQLPKEMFFSVSVRSMTIFSDPALLPKTPTFRFECPRSGDPRSPYPSLQERRLDFSAPRVRLPPTCRKVYSPGALHESSENLRSPPPFLTFFFFFLGFLRMDSFLWRLPLQQPYPGSYETRGKEAITYDTLDGCCCLSPPF